MKELVEFFKKRGVLFRSLEPLDPKAFGIKKRLKLYRGVDLNGSFVLVVTIERKSRVLQKEAEGLESLAKEIEAKLSHRFKRRYLLLQAPICSKAKRWLQENGWRVYALV